LKRVNEYEAAYQHEETFAAPFSVHEKVEKEIALTKLETAMLSLKEEQRISIDLFFLQEKCYSEVTEITGYELKKVKSYIQNGKRNLANMMLDK
jgi:RNA polymerase sigma-70 factor (ECF subfamily)